MFKKSTPRHVGQDIFYIFHRGKPIRFRCLYQCIDCLLYTSYDSFEREARELIILSENDFFKSILPSSSYFLEHKEGYLVLCNIFMMQNETEMH